MNGYTYSDEEEINLVERSTVVGCFNTEFQ